MTHPFLLLDGVSTSILWLFLINYHSLIPPPNPLLWGRVREGVAYFLEHHLLLSLPVLLLNLYCLTLTQAF